MVIFCDLNHNGGGGCMLACLLAIEKETAKCYYNAADETDDNNARLWSRRTVQGTSDGSELAVRSLW